MKKIVLSMFLLFFSKLALAQLYNISPTEGKSGFIIAGILFAVVALITLILYVKKRRSDK